MGHIGDGFLRVKWPNRQCQSTAGSSSPKHRLQSHQVHLTMLRSYTCMQYTVRHKIYKNESKHSEMSSVRQNPVHRTVRSVHICVCIALCTTVVHNIAQNRSDNFPSYPPDNHHCSDYVYLREGGNDNTQSEVTSQSSVVIIRSLCYGATRHTVWS